MATQTGSYDFIAAKAAHDVALANEVPNLTPFFGNHNADGTYPDGGTGGYWQPSQDKSYNRSCFTALEDGWVHLEACNTAQKEFVPPYDNSLKAGDKVTMLVEYRNVSYTGSGANFYTRNYPDNVQLPANWFFITTQTGDGEVRHVYTVSSATGNNAWNGLANVTFTAKSSSTWTGDIRISFYKGEYSGPYKPYVGEMLYATRRDVDPLMSKTYTGIIGTANTAADASFYFAKVHPDDYNGVWQVKLRINVTEPVTYQEIVDVTVSGRASAYMAYDAVSHRSNSALAIYYLNLYRAKQAGITAGKGHALGFGLRGSTNPANATYARTITVEVLEQVNCTVQLLDAAVKYASMDGTGTTNYDGLTELYIGAYGQNATNNGNTYDRTMYNSNVKAAADLTAGRIVCGTSAGYKNIAAGTAFDIGYPLLYNNTAYKSGGVRADLDLVRTNINFTNNGTINGATAHELVFLKGTVVGNSFTIAAAPFLTCKVPNSADGYCYLPLGRLRDSTTNGQFTSTSELWCFKDGAFGPVSLREAEAAKKTATNYITRQGSGDTWIHAENLGPGSDNEPISTTRGWRIGEVFELWRDGLSHFKVWVENSVAKVRVGLESAGHSVFSPDGMEVFVYDSVNHEAVSRASFGSATRIGRKYDSSRVDNESFMLLESNGMELRDNTNDAYFEVKDLRTEYYDSDTRVFATYDVFTTTALQTLFVLSYEPMEVLGIRVDGGELHTSISDPDLFNGMSYSAGSNSLRLPEDNDLEIDTGSIVKITYYSADERAKYITVGSRADGSKTGALSIAMGDGVEASGIAAQAFGSETAASGDNSHAEGDRTVASGDWSHAEGSRAEASGQFSHAEGDGTTASGTCSHAEGDGTTAGGRNSHASGCGTSAQRKSQAVFGEFNKLDTSGAHRGVRGAYAAIVGNGTSDTARSNALAVRWDGTYDVGNQQAVAGDNHAYPLFIWTSSMTNPESYSGTYPVSPCFVYYVPNNGLYYCEN